MVGASDSDFSRAKGALEAMGSKVARVGDTPGAGSTAKAINQLLCGVHLAAAGEALALARRLGVDVSQILDIVSGSAASSWMLRDRGPRMLEETPRVSSAVDIFVKDLGIVLETGAECGAETPLAAFTFVDMMRATLGIGPCEYLLDLEGQQRQFKGMPTCVARQKLNAIYASKQQVERRDEVEQCLEQVLAFVLHIRARIEAYSAFGRQTLAYLEQQKQALPELTGTLEEMEALARGIDALVDRRQLQIHTRERAVALVEQFRSTLLGYTGNDAPEQCHKIINALGEIGEAQDALVGECRREVKILRQKSALAMAADPRFAPVAREVRRQTWAVLRSPTSFEAPRN